MNVFPRRWWQLAACLWVLWPWYARAQSYQAGQTYRSPDGYIEYIAGNFPLLLTAPHGGELAPTTLPDRVCANCSTVNDANTQELARALQHAIWQRTGCWPHLVINRLHRRKMDANRDSGEAALGNPAAEAAWRAFHSYAEAARRSVQTQFGKGLYLDLHGHAHDLPRLELGYLLEESTLQLTDAALNRADMVAQSSIRHLANDNVQRLSHAQLLRGTSSLGTLLASRQYPAVPSQPDPFPKTGEAYFNGGYNTARYGSAQGGTVDGIQMECYRPGLRDNTANIERFADTLAKVVLLYLQTHYFPNALGCRTNVQTTNDRTFFAGIQLPNPIQGDLVLTLPVSRTPWVRAQLVDAQGKTCFTGKLATGTTHQVPRVPAGVWFLQIIHENALWQRVVVSL